MIRIESEWSENQSEIIIKREQDCNYKRMRIRNDWREARSKFFRQTIKMKLDEIKVTEKVEKQIIGLFLEQSETILKQLKGITRKRKQMKQLKQSLESIDKHYKRKAAECLFFQLAIKNNLDKIKVIRIQGKQGLPTYLINAFELFQVVHINKLLKQVSLKEVKVLSFEYFMKTLNSAYNKNFQLRNQFSWIKSFSPSKLLKISISAEVFFQIQNNIATLSKIDDLKFLSSFFNQLSEIKITIILGEWYTINNWKNTIEELWKRIRNVIKKLKLAIWGSQNDINTQSFRVARSVLFGGMASFAEIVYLQFYSIDFYKLDRSATNDYLAIEQSLSTFFKNNSITHLKLIKCYCFVKFPEISTLQSLTLLSVSFRGQFDLMSKVNVNNLKYIFLSNKYSKSQLRIDLKLFNQLQSLIIQSTRHVSFANNSSQSTSKIKHFSIFASKITVRYLFVLLPKLNNLTSLNLSQISFGYELLCVIPSQLLEKLHISDNLYIQDRDLKMIDQRWPQLSELSLSMCRSLSESVWSICKFKGLIDLKVDRMMLGEGNSMFYYLKKRGIKVKFTSFGVISLK